MVSPTTFFMLITGVIGGFQAGFMSAYVLTGGGPNGMTTTLSFYIYQQAYVNWRMGYASAVAWFIFVFVAVIFVRAKKYRGCPFCSTTDRFACGVRSRLFFFGPAHFPGLRSWSERVCQAGCVQLLFQRRELLRPENPPFPVRKLRDKLEAP